MVLKSECLQGSDLYRASLGELTIQDGLQNVRSKADRFPYPRHECVLVPVFKRSMLYAAHMSETLLTLLSVRTDPHGIFLELKSPRRMKGGGNCDKRLLSSPRSISTAGGI
jgi:hypothetical protein